MRILLAVDGSSCSTRAETLLRRMAGRGGHDVRALYVTPRARPSLEKGVKSVTAQIKESGAEMIKTIASSLRKGTDFDVNPRVVESDDVAGAILQEARKGKADLLVVGARGLTPLKTFLLGSVSQRVTRHAETSVLVARGVPPSRTLRVTVAVDGSLSSRRALDFLAWLGLPDWARITLVHAVENPYVLWGTEFLTPGGLGVAVAPDRAVLAANLKRGRRILVEAKTTLEPLFERVDTQLIDGHAGGAILSVAAKTSADLIVMGRRGLPPLKRFMLGSVSHQVSLYADASVLIVH
jgi:nucleotide-binding universal stress UspA family protein